MKQTKSSNDLLTVGSKYFKGNQKVAWNVLRHFSTVKDFSKKCLPEFYKFTQTYFRTGTVDRGFGPAKVNTIEDYLDDSKKKGLTTMGFVYSDQELANIKEVAIENQDQEKLSALVLEQPNSKKWVIGLHGWTENKYLALRQTYLYSQLGYNILTFDARGHGDSYGNFTDIGFTAPEDIWSCVVWLNKKYTVESYGVVGNSMGGASAVKFAEEIGYKDEKFKFVVDDCGFNDLLVQYRFVLENQFQKPWWQVSYGIKKLFQTQNQFALKKYNLLKNLKKAKAIPFLFIHGDADDFVPIFNTYELYEQKVKTEPKKQSQLLVIKGAKHVESIFKANKQYGEAITEFLKAVDA